MKTYSKSKMLNTLPKPSIKNVKLPVGEEITVKQVVNDEKSTDTLNLDYLLCTRANGGLLKIGIGEYARMTVNGGGNTFDSEEGEQVAIAEKFKITSSEDRTLADGKPAYPGAAYNGFQDFVKKAQANETVDWRSLSATGLKEGHGFAPVQNYTIELVG